jgi:multidrug efflux system membrane fusion protein
MNPSVLEQRPTENKSSFEPPFQPERHRRNLWWVWLLVIGALGYGSYLFYQAQERKHAAIASAQEAKIKNHTASVVVAPAVRGNVPITLSGLGTVTAFQTVTVKSRIDGQLIAIDFKEGQYVHKGDLLAQLDPRQYEVQLAQAQAQLERDQALLKDAQVNFTRYKELFAAQVIAKQQMDTQGSLVGQYDGAIAADKASIDAANLQLTYCRILAPISGRIGLRQVDSGNMIHAADTTGIAVITQMQPIAVLFSIPEDYLPEVLKRLRGNGRLRVDAYDRNGEQKLATGTLETVDNQIDQTTGTSKLKAVFDNSDGALFPNQFVNVKLLLSTERNALLVPAAAVQRGPQGTFVYLIKNNVTEVRPVSTGASEANNIAITKGLTEGDQVVVDGGDKLTNGTKVDVHPMMSGVGARSTGE